MKLHIYGDLSGWVLNKKGERRNLKLAKIKYNLDSVQFKMVFFAIDWNVPQGGINL